MNPWYIRGMSTVAPAKMSPKDRVLSIDALRGFDMFWIIGGASFLEAIGARWPSKIMDEVVAQFCSHVEWAGFRFHDCIFPLFLFIIGATLPYSIGRRMEAGDSKASLVRKIITRFVWLTFFGLLINGLTKLEPFGDLRLFGVLQRQAFGYLGAALIYLYTKPRAQAIITIGILVGYALLLRYIPVPGHALGSYDEAGNVANYVDRLMLQPGQLYKEYGDPEGPLSNIPSIATALLGLLAGTYIKKSSDNGMRKSGLLVAAGISMFTAGWIWNIWLPVVKKIWTSSFVLVAGGLSLVLLGVFYYILDVRKWTKGSLFWVVIGANAITAYMGTHIVDFDDISNNFVRGLMTHFPVYKDIFLSGGALIIVMLTLWGLYKKDVFLRV
jgi:predicted acyltransferase